MADLKEKGIALVSQTLAQSLAAVTSVALYIVPTGKEFTPFAVCISKISATITTATVTFGQVGALTDFLPTQTLTNITTAGASVWLMPIPFATPALEIITYTAGEVFTMDITAADAATADISVFGFINDA